jgi:hypothetical protein
MKTCSIKTNFINNSLINGGIRISIIVSIILFILAEIACNNESISKPKNIEMYRNNPHYQYLKEKQGTSYFHSRSNQYTVSEAIDYLNDGMNFIYCRPSDYYSESVAFTDTFRLAISSNIVEEDDLLDLMDTIAYFAGENYYADNRTEKEPLIFDINLLASTSPNYVRIEATFIMLAGEAPTAEDSYPYEDSWVYAFWYNEENEECNEEPGSVSAQALYRRDLNINLVNRNQTNPFYFINPEAVCFDVAGAECMTLHGLPNLPHKNLYWESLVNPNDVTILDNLYDFLMFRNRDSYDNYSTCLTAQEMNFYYEAMEDLALVLIPDPPGDIGFVALEVGWDRYISTFPPEFVVIWHVMNVMAADRVSTNVSNVTPLPADPH